MSRYAGGRQKVVEIWVSRRAGSVCATEAASWRQSIIRLGAGGATCPWYPSGSRHPSISGRRPRNHCVCVVRLAPGLHDSKSFSPPRVRLASTWRGTRVGHCRGSTPSLPTPLSKSVPVAEMLASRWPSGRFPREQPSSRATPRCAHWRRGLHAIFRQPRWSHPRTQRDAGGRGQGCGGDNKEPTTKRTGLPCSMEEVGHRGPAVDALADDDGPHTPPEDGMGRSVSGRRA